MNNEALDSMSIAELKALQTTIVDVLEKKTEALRIEIREQALAKAAENGIDPKTLFSDVKKPRKKRAAKSSLKTQD